MNEGAAGSIVRQQRKLDTGFCSFRDFHGSSLSSHICFYPTGWAEFTLILVSFSSWARWIVNEFRAALEAS